MRKYETNSEGYISKVLLPTSDFDMIYIGDEELSKDEYKIKNGFIIFSEEIEIQKNEIISAIKIKNTKTKTIWSWSAEKDDIILNGRLIVKLINKNKIDVCKMCGETGEILPPACCKCPKCGQIIWGC